MKLCGRCGTLNLRPLSLIREPVGTWSLARCTGCAAVFEELPERTDAWYGEPVPGPAFRSGCFHTPMHRVSA